MTEGVGSCKGSPPSFFLPGRAGSWRSEPEPEPGSGWLLSPPKKGRGAGLSWRWGRALGGAGCGLWSYAGLVPGYSRPMEDL